ncbi:MAG: autotransporter-associated beta strand repeat-containing protein [Kiritimatiellae bacterium]|nr:autotransporter-associated beta strand repeat-containing protein [Kiritimatiellia bacterium]
MNKSFFTALAASMASAAFATATLDPNTNILTFDVESGEETYGTALTSSIAGVVKTGAGTIILDAASTTFTGGKPITVSDGTIKITSKDALGSGNTVTVCQGATFAMVYDSGNGHGNDIVLEGGSTLYLAGGGMLDGFLGNVTLAGNATLDLRARRGFGKTLDLAGHTLTRVGSNTEFVFTGNGTAGSTAVVKGPGTIRIAAKSTVTLMGTSTFDSNVVFENVAEDAVFNMWNRTSPVPCTLKAIENAKFQMGSGLVNNVGGTPLANVWNGNIEIASGKTLQFAGRSARAGDYLTVGGVISGAGAVRIYDTNGAIIQFKGVNTYTGGTTVAGTLLRACVDGAVPTGGGVGALVMSGGELQLSLDEGGYSDAGVDALFNTLDNSVSKSGMVTVYTSAGTDATCAADFSRVHPSISISHKGAGKATLTGATPPGAMLRNMDQGTVAFGGDVDRQLWSFYVYGGAMDVTGGSLGRPYYDGKRDYRIGDSNNVANARMRVMTGGRLDFPTNVNGYAERVYVEDKGSKPSILEIHDGGAVTGVVQMGHAANTMGAIYQHGGTFKHLSAPGRDGWFSLYGKAFYGLYGGTFEVEGWLGLAGNKDAVGMMEVGGGTFKVTNGGYPLVIGRSAGHAELYMDGGAMTVASRIVMGGLEYAPDPGVEGGSAVLTLAGTNNPALTVAGELQTCERTNGYASVVNLNAGTLTAAAIKFPDWHNAVRAGCKAFVNFNGGTFKSSFSTVLSATGTAPTRVTVFAKGATIDYNGGNSNWNVPFLRPDGRGIKSITVPASAAVTGYAVPPVVAISGGGGEGATARVLFDPQTGTIGREVEVTSPGWGFIAEPTVTIAAPDMKTSVACIVELTEGEQEDGGLVKKGTGYMSVYAANSYTGDTVVAGGTFYMQNASAVPPNSNVRLAGGHLATKTYNPSRRRFGGYGTFASWDSNRLTVTEELFFDAADLEQGRSITCTGGHFYIGDGCVIGIDDPSSLTRDRYTLMATSGTGVIHGTARLAAGAGEHWKVSVSPDGKKLTLRRWKGTVVTLR